MPTHNEYQVLYCDSVIPDKHRIGSDFVNDSKSKDLSDVYNIFSHILTTEVDLDEVTAISDARPRPNTHGLSMTSPAAKPHRRLGILRASVDVKVKGNYQPWLAIIDSAAARSVVEKDSPLLLSGKSKKKALESLYFLEDANLFRAVQQNKPAYVRTLHGQRTLTKEELGVVTVRINKTELNLVVIVAKEGTLGEAKLVLDADTIQNAKVDVTGLFKRRDKNPTEALTLSRIEGKSAENSKKRTPSEEPCPSNETLQEWCGFVEEGEYIVPGEESASTWTQKTKEERAEFEVDVLLSEIKCKAALLNGSNPFKSKEFSLDMVQIAGDEHLPKQKQNEIKNLVKEYKDIFIGNNALPPVMKGKAPAKLLKREGAEQVSCPIPRWGPYQEKILRMWAEKALKDGLVEMAEEDCPYASRPHLVPKPGQGIRVTGDYQKLNETIPKRPMNLPNMEDQLRRHLGAKFFTLADAAKGYYQLLMEKESRQRCALWTPLGKVVPTRLPMGVKNAGILYQDAVSQALNTMPEKTRKRTSNYLDDHLTSGKTF